MWPVADMRGHSVQSFADVWLSNAPTSVRCCVRGGVVAKLTVPVTCKHSGSALTCPGCGAFGGVPPFQQHFSAHGQVSTAGCNSVYRVVGEKMSDVLLFSRSKLQFWPPRVLRQISKFELINETCQYSVIGGAVCVCVCPVSSVMESDVSSLVDLIDTIWTSWSSEIITC